MPLHVAPLVYEMSYEWHTPYQDILQVSAFPYNKLTHKSVSVAVETEKKNETDPAVIFECLS